MPANERQVGGSHYGGEYQYWDYAEDAKLGYLAGHTGKYVYRYTRKSGLEDLDKAIHFIDKCEEMRCLGAQNPHWRDLLEKIFKTELEAEIETIFYISKGDWDRARTCVEALKAGLG